MRVKIYEFHTAFAPVGVEMGMSLMVSRWIYRYEKSYPIYDSTSRFACAFYGALNQESDLSKVQYMSSYANICIEGSTSTYKMNAPLLN